MTRRPAARQEEGAALVEVFFLAVLLLVPVIYVVVVLARVQGVAFAVSAAARDAGRAFATAPDAASGAARARLAAREALAGTVVPWPRVQVGLRCAPRPCSVAPGSTVTVSVRAPVGLPGLAALLCSATGCPASIPVRASHTERIDCYVAGRAGQC